MILSLALSLALAAQQKPGVFQHGTWRGRCYRAGSLGGMDHELCKAWMWVEPTGPGAEITRSAEGLKVKPWPGECHADFTPGLLTTPALAGRDRGVRLARFVETQMRAAVEACGKKLHVPRVRGRDMAALLRDTDRLAPGSFVPRDPAARAPAAAKCGQELARAWKESVRLHPLPEAGSVGLMMYTMSEQGPERAEKRFESLRALMEDAYSFGTGPGGAVIFARKPAGSWRDASDQWFVTICDVAIEAWSSFVELSLYAGPQQQTPIFSVRAQTGVAGMDGFAIWSGSS